MASSVIQNFVQSIQSHFIPASWTLENLQQLPYTGTMLLWLLFFTTAVAIPFKIRTGSGQLLGFLIATTGAVLISMSVVSDGLQAKEQMDGREDQLTTLQRVLKVDQKKRAELMKAQANDQQSKAITESESNAPANNELKRIEQTIRLDKKAIANVEQEIFKLKATVDLAGLMMNFAAMTLGGLGAGLITAMATSTRSKEEEAQLDQEAFVPLLRWMQHVFCYVAFTSVFLGIAAMLTSSLNCTLDPIGNTECSALLAGLTVSLVLSVFGFTVADPYCFKKLHPLPTTFIGVLTVYFYVKSFEFIQPIFGLGWPVFLGMILLLAFHDVRRYVLRSVNSLIRLNQH